MTSIHTESTMIARSYKLSHLRWVLVLLLAVGLAACSGTEKKKEKPTIIEKKGPSRAEKLGLTDKALASFELASKELKKEKPNTQSALDNLETATKESPTFAEAQYNLGLLKLQLDEPGEAVVSLEKARELDPSEQEYALALGRAYAGIERYDEAHSIFEEVVARAPENLYAKNNLAVLELKRGNTDNAIKVLQEILREDPKNVAALNTMGRVYRQAGNLSLARYVFEEKALKVAPNDPDLHNNLGLVFLDLQQVPQAVEHFEKAIEADPNYFEARLNLGTIVLEYLDYKRAEEQFAEAVRVVPANCQARLGLAASKFAVGQYKDSVENYNYFIGNCDEKHVSAHERLAKLYQSYLESPEKALDEYRTLVSIAKTDKDRKNYEAMVGFLESQAKQAKQKAAEPKEEKKEEPKEKGEDAEAPPAAEAAEDAEATDDAAGDADAGDATAGEDAAEG